MLMPAPLRPHLVLRNVVVVADSVAAASPASANAAAPALAAALAENRELRAEVLSLRRLVSLAARGEDPNDGDPELDVVDAEAARAFRDVVAARAAALVAAASAAQEAAAAAAAAAAASAAAPVADVAVKSPAQARALMQRRALAIALLCLVLGGVIALIIWGARSGDGKQSCNSPEGGCQGRGDFHY